MRTIQVVQHEMLRFRVHHRYDHRFWFLLLDAAKLLAKLSLFALFTWGLWYAGDSLLFSSHAGSSSAQWQRTQVTAAQQGVSLVLEPEPSAAAALQAPQLATDAESSARTPLLVSGDMAARVSVPEPVPVLPAPAPTPVLVVEQKELQPMVIARVASDIFDERWLMAQEPAQYTIQIGSTPNLRFLRRFALLLPGQEKVAIYPYKYSSYGELEYGLALGMFNSLGHARKALATLDERSRRYHPWIRDVRDIQDQIRLRVAASSAGDF